MKFFSKELSEKNEIFSKYRVDHEHWRKDLQSMNKPFFMLPNDFKHLFLKDISGGALKLYLFLGFHSKYHTGESWYTNEEISYFFEKDSRTISNWFKELETAGLIFRAQKGVHMKANTFLKPYGFFINKEQIHFGENLSEIEEDVKFSKERKLIPEFALIMNYGLKELTLIIIYREPDSNRYTISCFFEFKFEKINEIRGILKKKNIRTDIHDLDYALKDTENMEIAIYNNLIKFLDEKAMWK